MNESELRQLLTRGEDSRHQFKRDASNADSVAAELAAFTNSGGGRLFLGVADDDSITGVDITAVRRLNQLLSNSASQHVRPPVHPLTENVQTARGIVVVASVPDGLVKPYVDHQGRIWVKQGERGFNTLGQLEIPEQALEELLVNALIHRDYFTSASIRLMVFIDRVEIVSPGHLPDNLDTDAIRLGATNRRNPTLTEHAVHILPYRGLGTGIPRALRDWPAIELMDDVAANQFRVIIQRPAQAGVVTEEVTAEATGEVTAEVTGEVAEKVLRRWRRCEARWDGLKFNPRSG